MNDESSQTCRRFLHRHLWRTVIAATQHQVCNATELTSARSLPKVGGRLASQSNEKEFLPTVSSRNVSRVASTAWILGSEDIIKGISRVCRL